MTEDINRENSVIAGLLVKYGGAANLIRILEGVDQQSSSTVSEAPVVGECDYCKQPLYRIRDTISPIDDIRMVHRDCLLEMPEKDAKAYDRDNCVYLLTSITFSPNYKEYAFHALMKAIEGNEICVSYAIRPFVGRDSIMNCLLKSLRELINNERFDADEGKKQLLIQDRLNALQVVCR